MVLDRHPNTADPTLEDILEVDRATRRQATELVDHLSLEKVH
jgi:hypothetical protein